MLRYRARSKEPHAIKLCGLTAPRLIQAFVWRVANISVKAVQVRRVEALIISLILVALGVVLTLVTLVGGLSRGVLLERFGWITLANGPEFRYLGMRFACLSEGSLRSPAFAERWSGNHDRCVPLNALACPVEEQLRSERFSKSGFSLQLERVQCSACRNATAVLLLPILITMATYVKLIQGTTARLMWRDTAINKVLLVLSGIIGGIANLGLMAIYHGTCITTLRRAELFLQPELGPGFGCLLLATVCKMLAALLNLCLGVHRQDADAHPDV